MTLLGGIHAARAEECATPTPACHLETGKKLVGSDPKRAAAEFLASYKLDERTETLVLYAQALEADRQYALAAETWQRVVTYRESEITAAKEQGKRNARKVAQERAAEAAESLVGLSGKIARVRIRFSAGKKPVVTRDGIEVDAMHEIIVNANHDELVFTHSDGKIARLPLALAPGDNVRMDAPDPMAPAAKPAPMVAKATAPKAAPAKPAPKAAPSEPAMASTSSKGNPELPKTGEPTTDEAEQTTATADLTARAPSGSEERSPGMKKLGLGIAATGLIVGGIAGSLAYLSKSDFDKAKDAGCNDNAECPIGSSGIDMINRSNDRARWAQIGAIGAGALVTTGVVMWLYGRSETTKSAAIAVRVDSSSTSATVAWRF